MAVWEKITLGRFLLVSVTFGLGWLIPWLLFRNNKNSDGFIHEPVSYVFVLLFTLASGAVIKSFSVPRIDPELLKKWNRLLFVLHLASGVALAWLADSSGTWTAYVTFSRSEWGKNEPDNTDSGFNRDTCNDGNCYVKTVPCLLSKANVEYMVLAFHLLSTLQHLAVCLDWDDHYTHNIENGNHWMRWFEYAFSASIMFASWAFLCGITDVVALVPLCVCVGTTQIFGYFSDAAARMTYGWDEKPTRIQNTDAGNQKTNSGGCDAQELCDWLRKKLQAFRTWCYTQWNSFLDNRPLQVKVVGVVYITYAAVLAWPLAVQDDIALLVHVTTIVLCLHFACLLLAIAIVWCKKKQHRKRYKVIDSKQQEEVLDSKEQEKEPDIMQTLYPVPDVGYQVCYIVYDLAQLTALVAYLFAQRDTIVNDHHDWARNIAYLALGGIALCMLKVAPYARNTKTTQGTREDKQQSGANRFISPMWIFTLAWVPYLLGAWFMTFAVFHDSLENPGQNVTHEPPDTLYVILVTQFLFFSCFAGAQLWYLWDPHMQRYLDTEFYFCLLSLVSKTTLAWSLYSGASGRKDVGLLTDTSIQPC
tara:strand:+ start:1651 stop:3414 length:1764 start_codon:yes stop_codon:yes gene_type:complete